MNHQETRAKRETRKPIEETLMQARSTFQHPGSTPIGQSARSHVVAFAGSRNGVVTDRAAAAIVEEFRQRGYGFLTGCASGIDACFRSAFIDSTQVAERSIVACSIEDRARRFSVGEVFASTVVPPGLSPAAALHRRTVWIIKHCSILVLFPVTRTDRQEHSYYADARRSRSIGIK